jgi:ParB-like nuclease domain
MSPSAILPPSSVSQLVPLSAIPTDAACQVRVKIRLAVVRDYDQAMKQQVREGGLRFPPVVLFSDGQRYILADGFHRVLAAREAGLTEFPAEVRSGGERDALLYSISANAEHGLPRSNADKRKVVSLLLADPQWSEWSDHEIARHCGVSCRFVGKLRQGASVNSSQIGPRKAKRGDTVYEMQPRTSRGQETACAPGVKTTGAGAPVCDRVGLPLPAGRGRGVRLCR